VLSEKHSSALLARLHRKTLCYSSEDVEVFTRLLLHYLKYQTVLCQLNSLLSATLFAQVAEWT